MSISAWPHTITRLPSGIWGYLLCVHLCILEVVTPCEGMTGQFVRATEVIVCLYYPSAQVLREVMCDPNM